MESIRKRLQSGLFGKIQYVRMRMERYELKLKYLHPENRLREKQQMVVAYEQRMKAAMEKSLGYAKQRFEIYIEKMKGLSPLTKLNQGFSYVSDKQGTVIKSVADVEMNDRIQIFVTDGVINARVENTTKEDYHGR
jgi:exodeoxyribonuclease VII large subunit